MVMRGVQKVQSKTVTSTMLGVFREDPRTREVVNDKNTFLKDSILTIQEENFHKSRLSKKLSKRLA
jgi:hypothetical protein